MIKENSFLILEFYNRNFGNGTVWIGYNYIDNVTKELRFLDYNNIIFRTKVKI